MSEVLRQGTFTRNTSFAASTGSAIPRFHTEAVQDELASAAAGRPIFRMEERIQVHTPGALNQPVFRVTDEHRNTWPQQYEAFKRGEEMSVDGTPLEQWPVLNRNQVAELKALQIYTVEQCAQLPDTAVQRIGLGGRAIRERAKAYLDDAEAVALTERLTREGEQKDARIALLERQTAEQGALLNQVHGQLQALQNAPHPVSVHVPGNADPFEMAKIGRPAEVAGPSSLDALTAPIRRRAGRPTNEELAAKRAAEMA